jgi:PAS domain S-box-containing protein
LWEADLLDLLRRGGKIKNMNSRRFLGRIILLLVLCLASGVAYRYAPENSSGTGLMGTLAVLATSIALAWMAEMGRWSGKALIPIQMTIDVLAVGLVAFFGGQHPGIIILVVVCGVLGQAFAWDFFRRSLLMKQEQTLNQLRVQKARWEVRNIIDNIRSGLLTIDHQGMVIRVNPACCRILQMESRDMLGRKLSDVCRGGMEELNDTIFPVAQGKQCVDRGEVQLKHLGRIIPLGLNVNHVTAPNGKIIGAISIFTDLTREKEMKERVRESDRLAAIGELAASIAHEIRNPLASIRGSVEMLDDDLDLEGDQAELMALVLKESGRVNTIINDFLAYSRMRPISRRRFPGQEFRDEISLQIRQHIAAKGGRVRLHCDIQPEDMDVVADPGQLTQMTLNLVINACEAMKYNGDLHLCLRLLAAGTSQEMVVTDNGPGINHDIRHELFTPFATDKDEGTGLGLSIVQRIATAHGGHVKAEDAPGGGTTFRVRWPVVHVPQLQPGPAEPAAGEFLAEPSDSQPKDSIDELLTI